MSSSMPRSVRLALTEAVRSRYRASTGKAKRRILDEFIAATEYHGKSAIRVLNASPTKVHSTWRKSPLYDQAG